MKEKWVNRANLERIYKTISNTRIIYDSAFFSVIVA
jgi:hypothetical protein